MIFDHTGTNVPDASSADRSDGAGPTSGDLQTDRTTLRRHAERGTYDRAAVHAVLDAGTICHLAFAVGGRPWAVPMAYGRSEEVLYLHGAAANHALGSLRDGIEACATVTVLDGLVLARSAFHHSMNYRCAMVFGTAGEVTDGHAKEVALAAIVDHLLPGRSAEARPPSQSELRATRVIALPIAEASVKARAGGPLDDDADVALPIWAGHVPLSVQAAPPIAHDGPLGPQPLPESLRRWSTWPARPARRPRFPPGPPGR